MKNPRINYLLSEPRSAELIRQIVDEMRFDENGAVTWTVSFNIDAQMEILARNIEVENIDDVDTLRILTRESLKELRKASDATYQSFKRIFATTVHDYFEKPYENYSVVFFLNAETEDLEKIGSINLLGTGIETTKWRALEQGLELEKWVDEIEGHHLYDMKQLEHSFTFVPLVARVQSRNQREAFSDASQAIDLFRAILNLAHGYLARWIMRDPPLADFRGSPVYGLFDNAGKYLTLYYSLFKNGYQRASLEEQHIKNFQSISSQLRKPTDSSDMGATLKL